MCVYYCNDEVSSVDDGGGSREIDGRLHDHKVRLNIIVVYVVSIDVCYIVGAVEESSVHICRR